MGAAADNFVAMKLLRETGPTSPKAFEGLLRFPEAFVQKLRVKEVLRGHMGCVNRLAWNQEGTLLASGSDDRRIMLWRYPEAHHPPICIETLHQANIFGVAFLPCQNDRSLISGAMDYSVQLHCLEHTPLASRYTNARERADGGEGGPLTVNAATTTFNCHKGRVKMVEVEPCNPHLFWSASEDGMVRQFDTRCNNQAQYESPNVLLAVRQKARLLDLLAVRINKARPYQLAVASSDPYVRIYDRRKLTTGFPDSAAVLAEPLLKMAPPHMCLVNKARKTSRNATHVSFGARGDKIIASYHADHAYSFDVTGSAADAPGIVFPGSCQPGEEVDGAPPQRLLTARGLMPRIRPSHKCPGVEQQPPPPLPGPAETAKNEGNRAFFDNNDDLAIWQYTRALQMAPGSAMLYANRAAAFLKRDWLSDAWAALQDCETAIRIDPHFGKAHCRRVHVLMALGQLQAAREAAETFAAQFPGNLEDICRVRSIINEQLEKQRLKAEENASARAAALSREDSDSHGPSRTHPQGSGRENPSPMDEGSDDSSLYGGGEDSEFEGLSREGWLRDDEFAKSQGEAAGSGGELLFGDPRIAGQVHRMLQRFIGHCNVQTDIKEACFLGGADELVAAGSDDGRVFIYNSQTGRALRALQADDDVANCVQPHPTLPVLATSGIESVVKLWQPGDGVEAADPIPVASLVSHNQERLKNGTNIYRTVTPRVLAALTHNPELLNMLLQRARPQVQGPANAQEQHEVTCRMS